MCLRARVSVSRAPFRAARFRLRQIGSSLQRCQPTGTSVFALSSCSTHRNECSTLPNKRQLAAAPAPRRRFSVFGASSCNTLASAALETPPIRDEPAAEPSDRSVSWRVGCVRGVHFGFAAAARRAKLIQNRHRQTNHTSRAAPTRRHTTQHKWTSSTCAVKTASRPGARASDRVAMRLRGPAAGR